MSVEVFVIFLRFSNEMSLGTDILLLEISSSKKCYDRDDENVFK